MKNFFYIFAVPACFLFMCAQNGFAYSNVNQGCTNCHPKDMLHGVESHLPPCINCHATVEGVAGNVTPSKCIVCHPRDKVGKCNLVKLSNHASAGCTACHTDCESTSSCPASKVLGDEDPGLVTLRDFRDNVLNKSSLGKRLITAYYTNADAINAALDKNPTLKVFSYKALQSFIAVVKTFR